MQSITPKITIKMKPTILYCFVLLLFSIPVLAQSDRAPTLTEKTAIDKVVQTVMPIVKTFADNNWTLTDGGADNPEDYSVQQYPDVTMGVAPFSEMQFSMNQGTVLWNTEVKPIWDKIEHPDKVPTNNEEAAAYDKLTEEYQHLSEVSIEVHVNQKNIDVKPVKGNKEDLKIPGCYFSYKLDKDPITHQDLTGEYVLVFGNWKTVKLKYYSNMPVYEFSFTHSKGSPFVENIVIILKGNNNRIKEILQKTDWSAINKGLTP